MNSMSNDSVDIIIPIYRPREEFLDLLERLIKQSYQVNRIILINTEQKYFDERLFLISDKIEVHHIDKKDFDHAATRDMAIRMSDAKYVLFMTMDAMPASDKLVGRLAKYRDGMEFHSRFTQALFLFFISYKFYCWLPERHLWALCW